MLQSFLTWVWVIFPWQMNIQRNMTAFSAVVSGVSCSWTMNLLKRRRTTGHQSRCRTLKWKSWRRAGRHSAKRNGWMCYCGPSVWSRIRWVRVKNGCCWHVWFRWSKTTSIFVSLAPAVPESHIYIKKFRRTVFWFPADRPRLPTSFIIWGEKQLGWLAYGIVSPLMRSLASASKIRMASKLWRTIWHQGPLHAGKRKRLHLLLWFSWAISIRVWMFS